MSTRPDPERSGAAEIATRRCPRLRVVWDLCELTHQQKPRLWSLPARLGPITVHPTRWGVGPCDKIHVILKTKIKIDYHSHRKAYYQVSMRKISCSSPGSLSRCPDWRATEVHWFRLLELTVLAVFVGTM